MLPLVAEVIYCYLFLAAAAAHVEKSHNISLVVMAPFRGSTIVNEGWDRGPALVPAAALAAREVNNSTEILPDFNLQLVVADSGCSVTSRVYISFLRDIYENREHQIVGIIGPGCSGPALQVASLTSKYEVSLIHVTPSATSPQLEEEGKNTTYATISSALSYVQSYIELMEHNNWNRIATLGDRARTYFKQTNSKFTETVDSKKVIYAGSLLITGKESIIPLDDLRSSRARVVMVFAGSDIAAQMLCLAFCKDMLYPNYQWIFHDRNANQLVKNVSTFKIDGEEFTCTIDEMKDATNGVILNQFHVIQTNKSMTLPLLNKNYNDYYKEYEEEVNRYRIENELDTDNSTDVYGNSYHDAVWAMAIALHNASMSGVDLKSYTYNRNNDTMEIAKHLGEVHFDGVSGPIMFQNDTRSPRTVINIKQLWDGGEIQIGTFDRSREKQLQFIDTNESRMLFIEDTYEETQEKIHTALAVIIILITVVITSLTVLLQLANTFWYDYQTIKATSPNITHLVFSGCYLFSIALLIYSIQESLDINATSYAILCNTFTWCFIFGYTLIFGTICTKIWRVYRLFKHFSNERPGHFLSDNALIVFVILLLLVDTVICTTWNLIDPWMTHITEIPSTSGMPILILRVECSCNHITKWIVAIAIYKGTIALLLVALSILNRRIKRKDFQHTRKINTLIYGITMMAGVGMPLYFLLKKKSIYIGYIILSTILLTTILLGCLTLFLPPVLPVLKIKITGQKVPRRGSTRRMSFRKMEEE